MSFYGYHGETEAERTLGNRFHVDVEIRMDLSAAGRRRRHRRYASTTRTPSRWSASVVEDQQHSLIEAVADRVAGALLAEPGIESVKVRVGKQPPIAGAIDRCWVIIERSPSGGGSRMSAVIVDGKAVAAELREALAGHVAAMAAAAAPHRRSRWSSAATIPASAIYVRNKGRAAERAGVRFTLHRPPAETPPAS